MPDHPSKTAWERDNVLKILVKINRNTDPELYALLQQAANKSGAARDLMRQALSKETKQKKPRQLLQQPPGRAHKTSHHT